MSWEKRERNDAILVMRRYRIQKSAEMPVTPCKFHIQTRSQMASRVLKWVMVNASRPIALEERLL